MKKEITFLMLIGLPILIGAQTTDKEFEELYKNMNTKKGLLYGLNKQDSNYTTILRTSNETYHLLDNLYEFMNREHRLNGKGFFNFAGNETKSNSVYHFGAGVSIDQGLYPYELDFSADIQTLLNDGVFVANESNIDISFDFHPYVPSIEFTITKYKDKIKELQAEKNLSDIAKENNEYLLKKYNRKIESAANASGLWLENYIIAKRFSEEYLGIESRYEIGAGFVFSLYSNALTKRGRAIRDEINRKPEYRAKGDDLIASLRTLAPANNILQLSQDDIQIISDSRTRYLIANKKQSSKLRLSLLLGAFYKIEKTVIKNTINFNGKDTTMTINVNPTNRFKSVIRLGLVWKPKDKYKFRIYPFLLLPFDKIKNVVTEGNYRDEKLDYFFYLNSSLDIEVEKRFSIGIFYKYYYDNAPSRVFVKQLDNTYVLLSAQPQKSSFGISMNFDF